eukprot:g9924.t1
MIRRARRRVQKKYDPSESFSSRDIRLAIQLSLGKNVDTQPQNESKLPESEEPSESKIKDIMTGKRTRKKNPVRHKATLDNQTISGETDKPAVKKPLAKTHKKNCRKNPTGMSTRPRHSVKKPKLAPEKKEKPRNSKKSTNANSPATETGNKKVREIAKSPNGRSPISCGSSGRKRQSNDMGKEIRYKGIHKLKSGTGRFRANILIDGHNYHLGDYDSALAAACSYDQARMHMMADDENDLNFDWYMPSQGNVDRNTIKREYIRMLTQVPKTGVQSRAKGSSLNLKSNRTSKSHEKESFEKQTETTQTKNVQRNQNKDDHPVSKEERLRRNSELLQHEKMMQDKWWFKSHLNADGNDTSQNAMRLLSRTKKS